MGESIGWISIHRKMCDNEMWTFEPFSRAQAWIDLLLLTNHEEGKIIVRGNMIKIKRGQCGWSKLRLSKRWKWSCSKVSRFLNYLENEQQIEQQKDFVTSIITITNYHDYQKREQQNEQQTNSRRTADEQQTNTNNNVNNNNNDNNKYILEIFDFWNEHKITTHRDIKKHEGSINAALKLFSVDEIKEAISNYSKIVKSDEYFFDYSWPLKTFLQRPNGLEKFMSENKPFENYRRDERGGKVCKPKIDEKTGLREPHRPSFSH